MTPKVIGLGLAPVCSVVDGLVHVAYGVGTGIGVPDGLEIVTFTPAGVEVHRISVPTGFYNSFPSFSGEWVGYKSGAPTGYAPMALNVRTGEARTFRGEADGNYPIAVNDALGILAYQWGADYRIWNGSLIDGGVASHGIFGVADGLAALVDVDHVILRKDIRTSVAGMLDPVRRGDLVVGKGLQGGIACQLDHDVLRVALLGQDTPDPSCATDGTTYVAVCGGPAGIRLLLGSRADFAALPAMPVVQPPAKPIGPVSQPRGADGRPYDLRPFLRSNPKLQPRVGLSHSKDPHDTQYEVATPDGRIHYVKFADPDACETWASDDVNWAYILVDASGAKINVLTDLRWFPLKMAIGEAHAFRTGPHESIYLERGTCRELSRYPIDRRAWLHDLWDEFNWGPNLGEKVPTIRMAYDPTAGFHGPDRFVETNHFALGGGRCRWEAHRSDIVFANGKAEFTDASRVARTDFYLVAGPVVQPRLSSCASMVVPHLPPWTSTVPPKPTPTPFPPAKPAGGSMRVFLKLNGKYCGIDPTPVPGKSGDDAFPVYHDRAAGQGWEEVELSKQGDGRFMATFVAANRVLSIQPDGSLQSRAAGTYGGYENLAATTQPDPDPINFLYRVDGGKLLDTPLTIEEKQ